MTLIEDMETHYRRDISMMDFTDRGMWSLLFEVLKEQDRYLDILQDGFNQQQKQITALKHADSITSKYIGSLQKQIDEIIRSINPFWRDEQKYKKQKAQDHLNSKKKKSKK